MLQANVLSTAWIERLCPPLHRFTGLSWLFMGAANSDAKLYDDEIQAIARTYPDQFRVDYALSREQKNKRGGALACKEMICARTWSGATANRHSKRILVGVERQLLAAVPCAGATDRQTGGSATEAKPLQLAAALAAVQAQHVVRICDLTQLLLTRACAMCRQNVHPGQGGGVCR